MNATVAASIVDVQPTEPKTGDKPLPCELHVLPKSVVLDSEVDLALVKKVSEKWASMYGEQLPGKVVNISALSIPSGRRLTIPSHAFHGVSFDTPLLAAFDPFQDTAHSSNGTYAFSVSCGESGLRVFRGSNRIMKYACDLAASSIRFDPFAIKAGMVNGPLCIVSIFAAAVVFLVAMGNAEGERLSSLLWGWGGVVAFYLGAAAVLGRWLAVLNSMGESCDVTVGTNLPGVIPENARNTIRKARDLCHTLPERCEVTILAEARWSVKSARPTPPADPIICIWDRKSTLVYIDRFDCTPVEEYISREFTQRTEA